MTWTWCFYMLAVIFLLMGIVYRWPRAWKAGVGVLAVFAFVLHTAASGIRWYLAGRIPNTNMFEAVTAAAWLGAARGRISSSSGRPADAAASGPRRSAGCSRVGGFAVFVAALLVRGVAFHEWQQWGPVPTTALILTAVGTMILIATVTGRSISTHGLGLLAAAFDRHGGADVRALHEHQLDSDISPRMPVLNDLWLYIHTNMIIASYALIGMAYVTAAMYVVGRMLTRRARSCGSRC